MQISDSPPSPTVYWVPDLKLSGTDRRQLTDGTLLTDKHMDASAKLLAKQFPDMPAPQTLRGQRPHLLQPAVEHSMFFHNFCGHWVLSHLKEDVYLYDTLKPKSLHPDLQQQLVALYGKRTITIPSVQVHMFRNCILRLSSL